MKELLKNLDKAFENKIRLGVMSALMVNDMLDFNALKNLLDVTDGNLSTHLKSLEGSGYILMQKQFVNRKPNTRYMVTKEGKESFERHIRAIEQLLR